MAELLVWERAMRSDDTDPRRPLEAEPEDRAKQVSLLKERVRAGSYAVDLVELAEALTLDAMKQRGEPTKR